MQKLDGDIYLFVLLGMAATILLSAAIILFYIRYQKKFIVQREEMQQAALAYQIKLLHATIQSQEDERKRIGRDMHDDICGTLSNLRLIVSRIQQLETEAHMQQSVKKCRDIIDDLITKVRDISHDLSPSGLEIFGLADTLNALCDGIRESSDLSIAVYNDADTLLKKTGANTSLALYRVMQELLANSLKHSGAKNIDITLEENAGTLALEYKDDGKGYDPATTKTTGIGMHNIKSRIEMIEGSYTIKTSPGHGFCLNILLPIS